jgi:hypothetical protein
MSKIMWKSGELTLENIKEDYGLGVAKANKNKMGSTFKPT